MDAIILDLERRQAVVDGRAVVLGARVFELFRLLLDQEGAVVSKDDLIAAAWGGLHVEENNLQVQIAALRRILGKDAIITVAGRGYQLPRGAARFAAGRALPEGQWPSVAVLPFVAGAASETLAGPLVQELVDALSQAAWTRVVSGLATAALGRPGQDDIPAIAKRLGVRYVLEGSIERAGPDASRISARLVDGKTGVVLWTGRLTHPDAAPLDRLTTTLATQVDSQIFAVEMDRCFNRGPATSAWEVVARANAAYRRANAEGTWEGVAQAERGLGQAPASGPAHVTLGVALAIYQFYFAQGDSALMVSRARHHIDRALQLDPRNSFTMANAATGLCFAGEPDEGVYWAERVLALNTVMPPVQAFRAMGMGCALLDRHDASVAYADKAIAASPAAHIVHSTLAWKANALIRAGRWEDAAETLDQAITVKPDFYWPYFAKALLRAREGDAAGAADCLDRACEMVPELSPDDLAEQWARAFRGNTVAAEMISAFADIRPKAGHARPKGQ
ncbi:MAG: winged helix-turn-helix domain-containing protein [Caulobacteraceae bacterium]